MPVIDDRDPSLIYTGIWLAAGFVGIEYMNTTTWSEAAGTKATISFEGSQITVVGTIANSGKGIAPQSRYTIDGGASTTFNGVQLEAIQYRQMFFQSGMLSSRPHVLVIENLVDNGQLYLDYVSIAPTTTETTKSITTTETTTTSTTASATPVITTTKSTSTTTSTPTSTLSPTSSTSATASNTNVTKTSVVTPVPTPMSLGAMIDDRSSAIVYTGTWNKAGSSSEYGETITWTNTNGSTALFSFSGVQVSVWGTIGVAGNGTTPKSTYSVDNGTLSAFSAQLQASTQYKQCFFQSGILPAGQHTLLIENVVPGGQLSLDFITVAAAESTPASKSGAPLGAIIGGAVGGVVLLGLIAFAAFYYLRRRKSVERADLDAPDTPFPYEPHDSLRAATWTLEPSLDGKRRGPSSNASYLNLDTNAPPRYEASPA